ncbi:double-strand break repair protein AddB [Pseudoprimorskyibacter insulae]|uniref:PD-(D/E)XK endonuclease-like domain-containing protein n=1 Tax=Pseudoprimorskyibacter insulae TaxID=1695997 RepID=A0A2R8AUH0_9RHOB|nr:double-strand break repair protein AddB [Pseudoprimorskyibacter insulae]SPF79534.1 hypothetical protein PRI8871_01330 [Pseudoprimorskyibacter insulae]
MFENTGNARVFALPPGVDFAQALVDGLRARMADQPPHAMARVRLIVNTTRMQRRVRQVLAEGPAGFAPQVSLLTGLADPRDLAGLPAPVSPLRRRLELVELIGRLLDADPTLAARSSLYDLAESLAGLMSEMQIEGVPPEAIEALDVSDQSGHWQRALTFIRIVQRFFDQSGEPPDKDALQRLGTMAMLDRWRDDPPQDPVILAGSTGSRGSTGLLMQAVARLPQGAVVLPGFDYDMPQQVFDTLTDALSGEDHPQFRFARLMAQLDLTKADIRPWHTAPAPAPDRNKVMSLALRPAPVTHQWLMDGPSLPDLPQAMADVTLLSAPTPREEALCIAMRLRQAAETGQRAALITPDRMLTRQVTSALARWNILPDDSAGTPPQLTPPGRFLRHVGQLLRQGLTADLLLTLLKHPLAHSGADRNIHLLHTRNLELHIRRKGWPFPSAEQIIAWGAAAKAEDWAAWVAACFTAEVRAGDHPLGDWVTRHIALAEQIAAGSTGGTSAELWAQNAGRAVRETVDELTQEAEHGGALDVADYTDLFGAILARGEVRDRDAPHPNILIWGTLEARVMDADLLILGGLNEGSWPELPGADPWLNRKMRLDAGLLLPERRVGLSAHDFQQAFGAHEVWLTRSVKSADAETVPSRWLNRLSNLMLGLKVRGGDQAMAQMQARGQRWLDIAAEVERPVPIPKADRPSPCPPALARPTQISVTDVSKLIRDPYAIYARRVLRLQPLDPLQKAPDFLLRGTVLHKVLELFGKQLRDKSAPLTADHLRGLAGQVLAEQVPWPAIRHVWQARIDRVADWFVATEAHRADVANPRHFEVAGERRIDRLGFVLRGKADRIDIDGRGCAHIYDYKTGNPPSEAQQLYYDKQLFLEAAMIEAGGFTDLGPLHVDRAVYIGLGPSPSEVFAPFDKQAPAEVWAQFETLIETYLSEDTGFTARRAMFKEDDLADYDHLSRFGEWDITQPAKREVLT